MVNGMGSEKLDIGKHDDTIEYMQCQPEWKSAER
jgi:hypothetical protein